MKKVLFQSALFVFALLMTAIHAGAADVADPSSPAATKKACPALSMTSPEMLSTAIAGKAYAAQLEAAGGQSPLIFKLASGSLPTGLSLNANGLISGKPTAPGKYTFKATVRDSCPKASGGIKKASKSFSIVVSAPWEACPALSMTSPETLTAAMVGKVYAAQLETKGGQAPLIFGLASGSLATGLSLSANGLISGKPTEAGGFSFTVKVSDSCSQGTQSTEKRFTLSVY
ncbi:MAG TPA: Ig domain-containing protein [Dissulfurispiraceae bacterium]|nr:Ig domain-containing protein [Dissulfurispiraceae bacterium]